MENIENLDRYIQMFFSRANEQNDKIVENYFNQTSHGDVVKELTAQQQSKMKPLPDSELSEPDTDFYKNYLRVYIENFMASEKNDLREKKKTVLKPIIASKKRTNWSRLPILDFRNEILSTIRSNQITIVKGFTGCGKSTQIPQYIADDCFSRDILYNIVITQPRRFAAKALAERTAQELNCPVGELVGYQIGLDKKKDSNCTRILYCTTGVLLQRFISSNCNHFTHIILDEIHERSADLDMLFLILKKKLIDRKLNSSIILMSATFDTTLFQDYFTLPKYFSTDNIFSNVSPAIFDINNYNLDKSKGYTREIFYFEDVVEKLNLASKFNYYIDFSKSGDSNETDYEDFLNQNSGDNIVFDLKYPFLHKTLVNVVFEILFHGIEICQVENQKKGTVLIFLPGLTEIMSLLDVLKDTSIAIRYKWKFFILHSTVSLKEQFSVMQAPVDASRHIILATNIAESALTVPNVEYVIDFCLCKTLSYNRTYNNVTQLSLEWASKSSCEQRAGRTGRTNCGQVYRLIPREFYKNLYDYEVPEFEKIPLENYILKAKLIDSTLQPKKVFAFAINQPRLKDIDQSILTLKRTGALTVYIQLNYRTGNKPDYRYDAEDGDLTTLGYIMSFLPLDIALSKLIALGLVFDVTFETIVIAASHCTAGLFVKNTADSIRNYKTRLSWSNRSLSDSLTYLKAYKMYKTLESKFNTNRALSQCWCIANDIEYQRLCELETLIQEIIIRLRNSLKIDLNLHRHQFEKLNERDLILKVVIAGAFYPNYFIRHLSKESEIKRYESNVNFENTVMLSGFDTDTITTSLYVPQLRKLFEDCSTKIDFTVDASRIYMTFDSENIKLSTNDEEHPLHKAYSLHIDSFKSVPNHSSIPVNSLAGLRDTNINTSVYVALAFRKLYRKSFLINRYMPLIERAYYDNLLSSIQNSNQNYQLIEKHSFITKIFQAPKKYLLPKMPSLSVSCPYINLSVSNFICPRLFFSVYDHIYVKQMLHNIDLLTSCYIEKFALNTRITVDDIKVGELVIAPLSIEFFDSMTDLVKNFKLNSFIANQDTCIMARAEILKINSELYKPMLSLYFVDFGLTQHTLMERVYKLKCNFKFEVLNPLRKSLDIEKLTSEKIIFDYLFSIPSLAIKCELVRVKPISTVESVGNWLPQVNDFVVNFCLKSNFYFIAKIYALLNEKLYVELYPPRPKPVPIPSGDLNNALVLYDPSKSSSLNELLVENKLAEFKIDNIICEHYNTRCNYNRYNDSIYGEEAKLIFNTDTLSKSEFQIDFKELTHNDDNDDGRFTHNHIRIRGPISPLEVDFKGMTKNHLDKVIKISQNSVNLVTLESDIKAKHARLLVAGEINMNDSKSVLSLCNTTLMPNILDFPAFMCLLFAPFVELRVNKLISDKCYGLPEEICGAICGIGFDPDKNNSFDPTGDIDFYFDSSVSIQDIELINLLRYQISQFFYAKGHQINMAFRDTKMNVMYNFEQNLNKRQNKCRSLLFKLLNTNRIKRRWFNDQQSFSFPTFQWGFFNYDCSTKPIRQTRYSKKFEFNEFSDTMLKTIDLKAAVLPPFSIPKLNEHKSITVWEKDVMDNIALLEKEMFNDCYDEESKLYLCKLCMYYDFSKISLQSHACNYDKGEHKEAVYIFKRYYSIWSQQIEKVKQFNSEITKEDLRLTVNIDEDESTYNFRSLKSENALLPTLNSLDVAANNNRVDLYGRQKIYEDVFKSPYSLENLKRSFYSFMKNKKNSEPIQNKINEYFDDDEILLIENYNWTRNSSNF